MAKRVSLFVTCMVDQLFPKVGMAMANVLERLGYHCKDNGLLFSINAHMWTAVTPLVFNGTEAQKRKFLPGLCDGSLIGGNAMSEPNSGSDAFSLAITSSRCARSLSRAGVAGRMG